jgi:hypothetical protein
MYKTVICLLFCIGETLYLTLKEKHSLQVIENNVLSRMFEPKSNEVIKVRKLYNEELHNLYYSPVIIIKMKSRKML